MKQATALKQWMDEQGLTHAQLAQELGYGYDMIYKIATRQDRNITDGFKFRFLQRFGAEEAAKVFELSAQTQVEPVA